MPKKTPAPQEPGNGPERFKNRIVGYGEEATDHLLANPRNWRVHGRKQRDALEGVLGAIGWVQPVIVNRNTGFVVDGHLRVMLALRNSSTTVPVTYVDLTPAEEDLILATYDPIGEMGKQDQDKRRELFDAVDAAKRSTVDFLYAKKMTRLQAAKAADTSSLRTAPIYEITFAFDVAERKNVIKALGRVKRMFGLKSNADAFIQACRVYAMGVGI